jgi:uncharacterized membrane protein (GlpM family)
MEFFFDSSLLAKVFWSAAIVLGLAAIAEHMSTRIAGILSGAPLNAVLVYLFVGQEKGVDFVVSSVPHGIASFTATLAFVLTYYWVSSWLTFGAAISSAAIGVLAFIAVASLLAMISFGLASAIATTFGSLLLAIWMLRRIEFAQVGKPVRYTLRLWLLRGGLAAGFIVSVISFAEILGSRWAGLLTGFPSTLMPTLLIIHMAYGRASTHAIIRNFPVGMGSIILYILSVPVTFKLFGIYGGTVASLAVSVVYLTAVMALPQLVASRSDEQGQN